MALGHGEFDDAIHLAPEEIERCVIKAEQFPLFIWQPGTYEVTIGAEGITIKRIEKEPTDV